MSNEYKCMSKKIDHKRFKEIVDELTCDNCQSDYCFLKKFVESLHPAPRVLIQLKCVEKFKWEESEREGKDIDWNEAGMRWGQNGYAVAFAKVYDEDLSAKEIYKRTMAEIRS
jgi:hypothetical protein